MYDLMPSRPAFPCPFSTLIFATCRNLTSVSPNSFRRMRLWCICFMTLHSLYLEKQRYMHHKSIWTKFHKHDLTSFIIKSRIYFINSLGFSSGNTIWLPGAFTYHFPYLYILLDYQGKHQKTKNIKSLEAISQHSVLGVLGFLGWMSKLSGDLWGKKNKEVLMD